MKSLSKFSVESREFKEFINKIPFNSSSEFVLTENLKLHITKNCSLSYKDIFGQNQNDTYLNIVVERLDTDEFFSLNEIRI